MTKTVPSFPKLPRWLAAFYFFCTVTMYVAVEHRWWPIFLWPVIWPWSTVWDQAIGPVVFDWIAGSPDAATPQSYVIYDRFMGAYYIVVGTVWVWVLGKLLSAFVFRTTVGDEDDNEKS